jgi:hypothetical protein
VGTQLDERTKLDDTDTGDTERRAHIVLKAGGGAAASVTEAIVMGIELEALCGKRWVPSRDPEGLPVCKECVRLARERTGV